jgi:hypothetical protein
LIEASLQLRDTTQLKIEMEESNYDPRVVRIHDQLSFLDVITERHRASHPHALALGGSNLVATPLSGHFLFELREGEKDIQG